MTRSVRAVHLVSILLTALTMGMEFAHVLELGPRFGYSPQQYIAVTNTLYLWFAGPGAVIYVLTIPAAALLTWLLRRRGRRVVVLTGTAAVLQAVALSTWITVIQPVNERLRATVPGTVPPDFTTLRAQWELTHALGFVLFTTAFLLLLAARSRRLGAEGRPGAVPHAVSAGS